MAHRIGDLPHAIEGGDRLARDLDGKEPAVFLYYGTRTPIADRPVVQGLVGVDDPDDVAPICLDYVTDEHAFEALSEASPGGTFVGSAEDPETAGRTAADYVLGGFGEVERFLDALAR